MNMTAAFLVTLSAGLSTALGGIAALVLKRRGEDFEPVCVGFSAGVMIYIALVSMMCEADSILAETSGIFGRLAAVLAFAIGVALIVALDRLIPENINDNNKNRTFRCGVIAALAMAIHNLPEGMATFVSAVAMPESAAAIFAAIAVHNIPEGMAVASPILAATGSKRKAFFAALLSGVTEPIGGLVAGLVLAPFLTQTLCAILLAGTAGIMAAIAVAELFPTRHSTPAAIVGMLVMAVAIAVI